MKCWAGLAEFTYATVCFRTHDTALNLKRTRFAADISIDFHMQDSGVDRILIHSVTYNNDGDPVCVDKLYPIINPKDEAWRKAAVYCGI